MAFSLNYKMVFLLLVSGYLFAAAHATPTPLETVCNQTLDIDFCLNVFGADAATRSASLPGLAQIAIDQATDKGVKTRTESKERSFFTSDPNIRLLLTQCVYHYEAVLTALRGARFALKKGHYEDLYQHGSDAGRLAIACEQGFVFKSLPSPLTRDNLQMSDYGNIIEIIAGSLP